MAETPDKPSQTPAAQGEAPEKAASSDTNKPRPHGSRKKPAAHKTDAPRGRGGLLLLWLLLIAVAAAGGMAFLRLQDADKRAAANVSALEDRLTTLQETSRSQKAALGETLATVEAAEQRMQDSLKKLHADVGRSRRGWSLAEAEYFLVLASHRLLLDRAAGTARVALQLADARLRELGDPALANVRQALAADMQRLAEYAKLRGDDAALTLNSLITQVDSLPLANIQLQAAETATSDPGAAVADATDWRAYWQGFLGILKELVVIRRQETVTPLLAPKESFFLYQNLQLQLETARLAVLRGDKAAFTGSLATARAWLDRYFDKDAADVTAFTAALDGLAGMDIDPPLPDISSALKLLRDHARPAETPAAGATGETP
jgi:uroporphyrin-3 C-methyltransferase